MHPILFSIPLFGSKLDVPTYGVLLAAAFILILKTASVLARRDGLDSKDVLDLALAVFLGGLVGAKLLLILLDWDFYWSNPRALVGTIRSAGVFYGGLLAAIPVGIWFARRRNLPLWKIADIAGVCLPIGLTVGRIGCFAAGCCYGTETAVSWAVTFSSPRAHAATGVPLNVPLHPAQIYLSLNALLLAAVLLWRFGRKRFDGEVFLLFLILYGATRTFWETFRGDEVRGFLLEGMVSTSQTIGAASVVAGLVLLLMRRRTARSV